MNWVKFVLELDRRVIYSIVALLVALPLIKPLKLPVNITPEVRSFFAAVDALPAGSNVVIAGDYGPSSKPELQPMVEALVAHCFKKDLRVHLLTLWPDGPALLQTAIEKEAKRYGKKSGTDYCFLGYKAGTLAVILGMNSSVPGTFATDFYGKPTAGMPIYSEKNALKDFDFIIDVAAGQTVETWIAYGSEPNGKPIAISVTAVSAAQYYPFYQGRQIVGLAPGMKGTAEYEVLYREAHEPSWLPGEATKGMDAQSAVHVFIVFSIILANIAFWARNKREKQARGAA
jgi:hypothetical protein